jgi:hypothetical protein
MGLTASTVHKAAGAGDLETLASEIRRDRMVVEQTGQDDWTPLHVATMFGQLDSVVFLIAKGASVEAKTYEYATPLYLAASRGNLDVVRVLCENGADINAKNIRGHTPLIAAIRHKHEAVAMDLVARGADLENVTKRGNDAYLLADNFGLKLTAQAIKDARGGNARHAARAAHRAKQAELVHHTPKEGGADALKRSMSTESVDSTTGGPRSSASMEAPLTPQAETDGAAEKEPFKDEELTGVESMVARLNDAGAEGTSCLMCMQKEANVLLVPCRHLCVCGDCHAAFGSMAKMRCPICRTPVTDTKVLAM